MKLGSPLHHGRQGLSMMEILVAVAVLIVASTVTVATVRVVNSNKNKKEAMERLRGLSAAALTYSNDHNDEIPAEDAHGTDSWEAAQAEDNKNAWYNALPKIMGRRAVADFASAPKEFYTKENPIFIPGAKYPTTDHKYVKPLFAIAINSKLQRKDSEGKKTPLKRSAISNGARTVLFMEQGLPGETELRAVMQTKNEYNGGPKGNAKSFVGRYGGKGFLVFVDGGIEEVASKDLLTETGVFPFPPGDVVWCRTPDEDPNK